MAVSALAVVLVSGRPVRKMSGVAVAAAVAVVTAAVAAVAAAAVAVAAVVVVVVVVAADPVLSEFRSAPSRSP